MKSIEQISLIYYYLIFACQLVVFVESISSVKYQDQVLWPNETRSDVKLYKCSTDSNCESLGSYNTCLDGQCARICNQNDRSADCKYIHCGPKLLLEPLGGDDESSYRLIETNNSPSLDRYLRNKQCAWIYKTQNQSIARFIQVRITTTSSPPPHTRLTKSFLNY